MPQFIVHEHHARRLHFDLRLEIDKALKSWALPKGPSMNPKERRLAIIVQDHPLDYADFEGTIPEGMYGAGAVVIWDRGSFEITGGNLHDGNLDIVLHGRILKGAFALVKMSGKDTEWLFMKKKDAFADYDFSLTTGLP
jgi:bifunctional non-homologous end joining protein LigD